MRAPARTIRTVSAKARTENPEIVKTVEAIRKRFGPKAIVAGDDIRQPYRVPTGIFMFDMATCGGLPYNQLSMFHGKRSSGKTTAMCKGIAGAQRSMPGKQVALLDIEHTYDATWGGKLGVNNEELLVVQPDTGENAVDMVDALIRTDGISMIAVDSLAALVPNKEIEESVEDNATPGLHAKLITRMCRKLTNGMFTEKLRGHYVTVLVLNQHRSKIGGWSPTGDAVSLPGGNALEHTTMVQCAFKNKENIKKTSNSFDAMKEYNEHSFKLDKCKMNAGIASGEYQLMRRDHDEYNLKEGEIDDAPVMLAYAKRIGLFTGGGQSWSLNVPGADHLKFKNTEEIIMFLYDNRDVMWTLRCILIAEHAKRLNLPEYFINYLLGDPSGMEVA